MTTMPRRRRHQCTVRRGRRALVVAAEGRTAKGNEMAEHNYRGRVKLAASVHALPRRNINVIKRALSKRCAQDAAAADAAFDDRSSRIDVDRAARARWRPPIISDSTNSASSHPRKLRVHRCAKARSATEGTRRRRRMTTKTTQLRANWIGRATLTLSACCSPIERSVSE